MLSLQVYNAYKNEQRLHAMFSCSNFTMSNKIGYRAWLQSHYKIGISKDVDRRVNEVSKNSLSGKTEWFALTWLEVVFVAAWMLWFKVKPQVIVFLCILCLSLILLAA